MRKSRQQKLASFGKQLPGNLFSGFVVSLIALPLGLGLALASGAPPISGIIAAVVGGVIVAFLGGSHVTITGPGNGLVVVILGAITTFGDGDMYTGYLATLAAIIVSGVLMVLLGFLRLGSLSDFFPSSAIQGMLAAIGISILAKQFFVMIGHLEASGSTIHLLAKMPNALRQLLQSHNEGIWLAATIGVASLFIMIFYSKIRNRYFNLIPAPMWVVVLSIGLHYYFEVFQQTTFPVPKNLMIQIPDDLLGNFPKPDFSLLTNSTFWGIVFSITLISCIESLLSIKAVDKLDPLKRRSNANKDLKALGVATVISGFLGGLNVVTVIARSSVNVNNNGTNRSSNFFHATLLLIFVLVFSAQLTRIPLPALAAILVYTGYKLAAPSLLGRLYRVGREQLFIFLCTLISTLLTDLITGISIGIVCTLITHLILNQSLSLFTRNLLKPNVLMFKEREKDSYYVSVKNFCNFLNFFKLKMKLEAIAPTEDVVVDFSLCDFVDHTVLENIHNYQASFERSGGNFEIIGLDTHEADSEHPFAIRKLLPLDQIPMISKYLTRRQRQISETATELDWNYSPNRLLKLSFLNDFLYFENKSIVQISNRIDSPLGDFSAFDIEFSEGAFIAREVVRSTMLYFQLPEPIPSFTLDREGLLERIYHLAGYNDIDLDKFPDFSRRFFLQGEKNQDVISLFNTELVLFFESHDYYHIECNGGGVLVMQKERLASVKEIKAMVAYGKALQAILIHR